MPDTYGPIEAVYKTTYSNNIDMALQDKRNDMEDCATPMNQLKGKEMQAVELIGSSEALINQPENAPTPHIAPKHLGVFVKPQRITWARTIPTSTGLKAAVDYSSAYVQEAANAFVRARKKMLVDALVGPRLIKTGEDDLPAPVAFDATNQRIASNYGGSTAGLTVIKFVRALSLLMDREVDIEMEQITALITAAENEALYKELEVTNRDYRNKAVFEEKRVVEFMKVRLVHYKALPTVGNERIVPMFPKSGLHYQSAIPLQKHLERNPAVQYQPHLFLEEWYGATRSEDEKVVQILCG